MTCYFEVQENAKKLYGTRRKMLAVNINQDILKTYKLYPELPVGQLETL